MKKNILGVTLARGGSKGIKNKNLVKINGKPLIYYTIREAKKSKNITNYIVSTDSLKIKRVAEKFKAKVPFIRPKKFSSDKSNVIYSVFDCINYQKKKVRYMML